MSTEAKAAPKNHLPVGFYTMPDHYRATMKRSELQETMLATGGWILAAGRGYNIKAKHLAAGVYDVSLEERE